MTDNEDPYKVIQSDFQGFLSLMIRGSSHRDSLAASYNYALRDFLTVAPDPSWAH